MHLVVTCRFAGAVGAGQLDQGLTAARQRQRRLGDDSGGIAGAQRAVHQHFAQLLVAGQRLFSRNDRGGIL